MSGAGKLIGKKVLIVEDQYLIADDLAQLVSSLGGTPLGPHASSAAAVAAIDGKHVDYAILDIQLSGNAVYPLAEELRRRSVSFLFLTGFAASDIRQDFAGTPHIAKPHSEQRLIRLMGDLGWLSP